MTFEFNYFNWIVFFTDTEDFQIAENRLLRFRMAIYLDTKEVTLVLPVKFTLDVNCY